MDYEKGQVSAMMCVWLILLVYFIALMLLVHFQEEEVLF